MPSRSASSPLYRFNRDRNDVIDQVVERVTRDALDRAWRSPGDAIDYLLNEAAYVEMARLDAEDKTGPEAYAFWKRIAKSMGRATEEENAEHLRRIVARFAGETVGHFRPSVYKLATELLPSGVSYIFSRTLPGEPSSFDALRDRLVIEGEVGKLRRLAEVGTLVIVPTHTSHTDSILVTWALHEAGLPPAIYGADTHLFSHPLMAFFMANLGAYKVNRERRFRLYRRVLKAYSQVLIEHGYHSLFFPAGQRSRSNELDSSLKLGLLSTALEAYTENILRRHPTPNIFMVPVTVNYNLVLEARTLIEDALADSPRRRPIIRDDEFSDIRRIAQYVRSTIELGSTITVRFCTPMDVFGNAVDLDGESIDNRGRRVDPERYLWVDGKPSVDGTRDRAYTRLLARRVTGAFRANNVVQPLHVVAFALVDHLRRQHPEWSLERTLRFAKGDLVSVAIAEGETERLLRIARRDASEGRYRLGRAVKTLTASELLAEGLRYFGSYHRAPLVVRVGRQLRMDDLKLLYYYSNRLRGYDLERRLAEGPGGYR